jgi:hypothetical protein
MNPLFQTKKALMKQTSTREIRLFQGIIHYLLSTSLNKKSLGLSTQLAMLIKNRSYAFKIRPLAALFKRFITDRNNPFSGNDSA